MSTGSPGHLLRGKTSLTRAHSEGADGSEPAIPMPAADCQNRDAVQIIAELSVPPAVRKCPSGRRLRF